jgi:hypothetical protein
MHEKFTAQTQKDEAGRGLTRMNADQNEELSVVSDSRLSAFIRVHPRLNSFLILSLCSLRLCGESSLLFTRPSPRR